MPADVARLYPNFDLYSETAYHYTDSGGLLGIVEGHALWASSYTMLNDVSEIRHGVEEVLEARKSWAVPHSAHPGAVTAVEEYLDDLATTFERLPIYIISASKSPTLVNQYQGYAGGGGYAVGFGSGSIFRPFDAEVDANLWLLGWLNVVYEPVEKRNYVHRILDDLVAPDSMIALAPVMGGTLQWVLEDSFATLVAVLKHEAFAAEQEVRYIFTYRGRPHFRPTPRGVVPFVKVGNHGGPLSSMRPDGLLDLREVFIGPPSSTAEPRMRSVELLLSGEYSAAAVADSGLPFVP